MAVTCRNSPARESWTIFSFARFESPEVGNRRAQVIHRQQLPPARPASLCLLFLIRQPAHRNLPNACLRKQGSDVVKSDAPD